MVVMPITAPASDTRYAFRRSVGPVPGSWAISLRCPHGVTTAYVAARRLRLPDEGVAILGLLVARHRRERPRCRCLSGRSGR